MVGPKPLILSALEGLGVVNGVGSVLPGVAKTGPQRSARTGCNRSNYTTKLYIRSESIILWFY